jgi:putative FmdB family regulatory protein
MARYDYKCESCKEEMEIVKGMNEPNPPCPVCEEDTLTMVISNVKFATVGMGWGGKGHPV